MRIANLLVLIVVVFLLSAAAATEPEKTPGIKVTQETAKSLAINYAKTNLNASANVTVVEIGFESVSKLYRVKLKDNANEYVLNVDSDSGAVTVYNQAREEKPNGTAEAKGESKEIKEEKQVKTEEKKQEEESKEKNMRFAQTGNNYSGKYVSFQNSGGGILNYTLGGKTIFTYISIGFTPASIIAEGSEVKFTDREDMGNELDIHDNPDGLMMVETKGSIKTNFTLAAGISAKVNQSEVELEGANASIVSIGREGTVNFTLSGSTLGASLDHVKIMFKSMPLTARTEKEKELDDRVLEGIARGKIGAIVSVEKNDSHDEVSLGDVNITVNTVENNTVGVNVSSNLPEGKTVVIRVSNDILNATSLKDIRVQFDGVEVQQADNYADVLDLTGDKPKYLVVIGARDVEALVSVPKFSEHQITLTTATTAAVKTPGFTAMASMLSLAFAVWYIVRRK